MMAQRSSFALDVLSVCMIVFGLLFTSTINAANSVINYTTSNGTVVAPQGYFTDASGNRLSVTSSSTTKLQFDGEIKSIGSYAFHNCSTLTSLSLPNSVTSIGYFAFSNCTKLNTPIYNTTIFGRLPENYNNAYTIPDGIKVIASAAFRNCTKLPSVSIPAGVELIDKSAFAYCSSLTSIIIPGSVTKIDEHAFESCTNLNSIYVGPIPAQVASSTFNNIDKNKCTLYVPIGSKSAYENTDYWNEFVYIIEDSEEPDTDISVLDNAIYLEHVEGHVGGSTNISVRLKSTFEACAIQFIMKVPEGVTIKDWHLSSNLLATEVETPNDGAVIMDNGKTIKIDYSLSNETFNSNDGEIVTINVNFCEDMVVGSYPIYLTDCHSHGLDDEDVPMSNVKTTLVLEDYLTGDANDDGEVLVGDVTALLNYIVGRPLSNFNKKAADINGDGDIQVGDVIGLLNIIVNQTPD